MGLPPYYGQPCWRCNGERLSFRYENYNDDSRSQASMYLCWSCIDCGTESIGVIYDPDPCNVACGWAFDAGMREEERDRAQRCFVIQLREHKNDERAAVAAERERCLAWAHALNLCVVGFPSEFRAAIQSGAPAPREG